MSGGAGLPDLHSPQCSGHCSTGGQHLLVRRCTYHKAPVKGGSHWSATRTAASSHSTADLCSHPKHQAIGEGPWLRHVVPDGLRPHSHPGLLEDFAGGSGFHGLPRVDEACGATGASGKDWWSIWWAILRPGRLADAATAFVWIRVSKSQNAAPVAATHQQKNVSISENTCDARWIPRCAMDEKGGGVVARSKRMGPCRTSAPLPRPRPRAVSPQSLCSVNSPHMPGPSARDPSRGGSLGQAARGTPTTLAASRSCRYHAALSGLGVGWSSA